MFSDKIFQLAFLISVVAHGAILFQNVNFPVFSPNKKEPQTQLVYVKKEKENTEQVKITMVKREPSKIMPASALREVKPPPPFINKDNVFQVKKEIDLKNAANLSKPIPVKSDIIAIKNKIIVPPIDVNKINNPSYLSYYQIVREKIKRAAYEELYTGSEAGEVYASFVVARDGRLIEARLANDKSSGSEYLRKIALASIKDAAPFPYFPKDLDYMQLPFDVIIIFKSETE